MTTRRDFIRTGALWTLGAAILGPEALERLNWRRKYWALGEMPGGPIHLGAITYERGAGWLTVICNGHSVEYMADVRALAPGVYTAHVPVISAGRPAASVQVRVTQKDSGRGCWRGAVASCTTDSQVWLIGD